MSNFKKQLLAGPYLIWMIGFILLPLVFILYYAITAADGSFTLARTPVTVGVSDGVTVAVEGVAEGDEVADNAEQYLSMVGMRLTLSENSALTGSMAAMMAMGGGMRAGN